MIATSDLEEARAGLRSVFPSVRVRPREHSGSTWRVDMTLNALRVGESTAACLRFGQGARISADPCTSYCVNVPLWGVAEARIGTLPPVLATPEQAMVFTPEAAADVAWGQGCTQMCVVFARHTVDLELAAMLGHPIVHPIEFAPAMSLTAEGGRTWIAGLRLLERHTEGRSGILDRSLTSTNLEKLLIDNLLLTQPHNYTAALAQAQPPSVPTTVRQAIEVLHSHPEKAWTTTALAREVAVSPRTLQEGFHRGTGVPPMRYLRDIRLDRVHADLLDADGESATVSQIARRWGFLYLGRFAGSYREKFGETPSETLRRERRVTT